jgi:hypothetical protein
MVEVDEIYVTVTEKCISCIVCMKEIDNLLLLSEPAYPFSALSIKIIITCLQNHHNNFSYLFLSIVSRSSHI